MSELAVSDPLGCVPRLEAVRAALATRTRDCAREPSDVTLIAVSKTYTADEVWPTIALGGQTVFGENRVQEAMAKWADLRARAHLIGKSIELHLIGPMQINKAREAVEFFDVIETIDREKIAGAVAAAIVIGLLEAATQYVLGVRFGFALLLVLVIAVLIWRPAGFFGKSRVVRL